MDERLERYLEVHFFRSTVSLREFISDHVANRPNFIPRDLVVLEDDRVHYTDVHRNVNSIYIVMNFEDKIEQLNSITNYDMVFFHEIHPDSLEEIGMYCVKFKDTTKPRLVYC